MTYQEYKKHLEGGGWNCAVRYMGTGSETGCEMRHPSCSYILTVTEKPDGVVCEASVCLKGFMTPITTGQFGSPWKNGAFFTQVRRLEKIQSLVGDKLV